MLFCSLYFLFVFLPICLFIYYIVPNRYKNIILLLFSILFYTWGEPKFILILLLINYICYILGLAINFFDSKKKYKCKRIMFILSISFILLVLIYFKYSQFFIENVNKIFSTNFIFKSIHMPIGISFFTFQIISYLVDLYRKKIKIQKSYLKFSLYILFFPQLIAGPVIQYSSIEKYLENRKIDLSKIALGIEKFIIGLGKKVIIANQLNIITTSIFNDISLCNYSSIILLIGIVSYTFEIYFDFSGYSDMAIGLSKFFGFDLDENFNYPYISKSITDFWKRWHISLSNFFKEYVYIPLGGNQVGKIRWIINMFVVWILTGLWHGAAWNFIIWGIYYCILLVLEKTCLRKIMNRIPNLIKFIITFILINIGWMIFRFNNLNDLMTVLFSVITNNGNVEFLSFLDKNPNVIFALPHIVLALLFSTPYIKKLNNHFINNRVYIILKIVILIIIFIVAVSYIVSFNYNSFIYFEF